MQNTSDNCVHGIARNCNPSEKPGQRNQSQATEDKQVKQHHGMMLIHELILNRLPTVNAGVK